MKNIICFLTIQPKNIFYNFVKRLPNQENIYICIDDNDYNIPDYDNEIKIIKYDSNLCENAGFKSSVLYKQNQACSRDKALYYFYTNNIEYDNIWFIEEDVFIPSIKTIENIDKKYGNEDLLASEFDHELINEKRTYGWHWESIDVNIEPPYVKGMISAIRCSKKLLTYVFDHAVEHKSLFLDELLFRTLAIQNGLITNNIQELSTIHYINDWKQEDININNLYHPIKSMQIHEKFRKYLNTHEEYEKNESIDNSSLYEVENHDCFTCQCEKCKKISKNKQGITVFKIR